ncbi:hypothetical protein OIU76_015616 [Salix suchowensis]|nr:hypothetical protein OIU76_015616 [Salix suchowensis]
MGCTTSKLDDLPAVALCRERCTYLDDAIQQRFALAEAHIAYIHSLKRIDEDDEDDISHLHHSDNSSPLHSHGEGSGDDDGGGGGHIQYMSSEYMNTDQDSFPGGGVSGGGGGGDGGYYGPRNLYGSSSPPPAAVASSSKPPPAPPSPLRASAWDFLNVFENYDKSYPQYTPSRNSKELREEEGIPDLEDEDYQHEVVKEVHGDQKYKDEAKSYSKSPVMDGEDGKVGGETEASASLYQARPSVGAEEDRVAYEVHVVDKKIVDNERSEERGKSRIKGWRATGSGNRN